LVSGAPCHIEASSFIRNGTPANSPSSGTVGNCARAMSYSLWITALSCGFTRSITLIAVSSSSSADTSFARTAAPSPTASAPV
jgi:hypothetical protein